MPKKIHWGPDLWKVNHRTKCWTWQGRLNAHGYGVFGHVIASRHALSLKLGRPIPRGMVAMHTCDNPPCVNPDHLREGTQADNLRDMREKGRFRPKTKYPTCPYGHPYNTVNTYVYKGAVSCRTCRRERVRQWRERQKKEQAA